MMVGLPPRANRYGLSLPRALLLISSLALAIALTHFRVGGEIVRQTHVCSLPPVGES
jgi:hypothetical protein